MLPRERAELRVRIHMQREPLAVRLRRTALAAAPKAQGREESPIENLCPDVTYVLPKREMGLNAYHDQAHFNWSG
jgi:hypothetical protein